MRVSLGAAATAAALLAAGLVGLGGLTTAAVVAGGVGLGLGLLAAGLVAALVPKGDGADYRVRFLRHPPGELFRWGWELTRDGERVAEQGFVKEEPRYFSDRTYFGGVDTRAGGVVEALAARRRDLAERGYAPRTQELSLNRGAGRRRREASAALGPEHERRERLRDRYVRGEIELDEFEREIA